MAGATNSRVEHTAETVVRKRAGDDCGLVERAAGDDKPLRFIISSESPDLTGDVVVQAGLKPVRPEVVAQIDHGGSMRDVIGAWKNIVTRGKKTFADLHLLPPGVSRTADLVRAIADAGVRLSASIGFKPTKYEEVYEDKRFLGYRYLESLLVETSVVVVPAQTEAVQVRSLLKSERDRATLDQLVAQRGSGLSTPTPRSGTTQPGRPLPSLLRKGYALESHTMKVSEQIVVLTDELNALRDKQTTTTAALCDCTDEEQKTALETEAETTTADIIKKAKSLDVLKAAEESLKPRTGEIVVRQQQQQGTRSTTKHEDTIDAMNVVRAAGAVFEAYILRVPVEHVLERRYAGREMLDFVTKATQNPAMTNVPGWAQELVRETFGAFMELLKPESVVPQVPMTRYTFDGNGVIKIPRRNTGTTPNLAAAFRAEGAPIRVGSISLGTSNLTPKSMGVIATFTNELFERSTPNIETVCREAILGDTALALDLAFLGAAAGTPTNPAGLQTYATGTNTAASTGNTVAQITADIRGRVQVMTGKGYGRKPVWIMNPARLAGLQLAVNAAGVLAFPSTLNKVLLGYPIIDSITVPGSIVYLIDAAEVAFAGGVPKFLGTEVATLHEEDTTPLPIVTGAAPGVTASPVRSLYQTNSSALRALWEVDWTVARPDGPVQTLTAVAW